MSDKTATESLRQLLDERGVEWAKGRYDRREFTRWYIRNNNGFISASFRDVFAGENGKPDLRCEFYDVTPEQAVEATLGRGTCKVNHSIVDEVGGGEIDRWTCDECGHFWWSAEDEPAFCPRCGREVEQ